VGDIIFQLRQVISGTITARIAPGVIQSLCHNFLEQEIAAFLVTPEAKSLSDAVIVVQTRTMNMKAPAAAGILAAALILGGPCLAGAVQALRRLANKAETFEEVFSFLSSPLSCQYGELINAWFSIYWSQVREPQLELMKQFKFRATEADIKLLTLSLAVDLTDPGEFI
jgi:hypothetical protein